MSVITEAIKQKTYTDENGVRYFSNYNGARVNYPAGNTQPSVIGVTVSDSASVQAGTEDNITSPGNPSDH